MTTGVWVVTRKMANGTELRANDLHIHDCAGTKSKAMAKANAMAKKARYASDFNGNGSGIVAFVIRHYVAGSQIETDAFEVAL